MKVFVIIVAAFINLSLLAGGIEDKLPILLKSIDQSADVVDIDKAIASISQLQTTNKNEWLLDYYKAVALIKKFELTMDVATQLSVFKQLDGLFANAETQYPTNSELYALKANYLLKKSRITNSDMGQYGQQAIIKAFQTAKELDKNNPRAFLVSATYYLRSGEKDLSKQNAAQAVELYNAQTQQEKATYPRWGENLANVLVKKLQY